jgi:hypothetical protein
LPVLVLTLAGCTPGGSAQPPGGTAPAGSPAVAVRLASPPPAWTGARLTTVDAHLPGGMLFGDIAVTPDGKVFGFTFTPAAPTVTTEAVGNVVLLNPADHRVQTIGGFAGTTYQVLFADADQRWVTWTEASHEPGFEDWILFVHDRQSGRTRTVASAPMVGGVPAPTPYVEPRTDHDLLVWSAGVTRAPLGQHIDCFLAPAAGEEPIQVLATDCFHPIISWPYVVYGQHVGPLPGGYVELTAMDLQTRAHHAIGGVQNSRFYALAGTSLIYTTEDNKTIHLVDIVTQVDQTLMDVRAREDGFIQFPAISDRLAIWEEREAAWAFDRKRGQLVRLRAGAGFSSVYLRGSTLVWADYTKANTTDRNLRVLRLLDTNQLK